MPAFGGTYDVVRILRKEIVANRHFAHGRSGDDIRTLLQALDDSIGQRIGNLRAFVQRLRDARTRIGREVIKLIDAGPRTERGIDAYADDAIQARAVAAARREIRFELAILRSDVAGNLSRGLWIEG